MSYLIRSGTSRNSISFGGSNTTSNNYLRRTNSGRNNIQWYTISNNGTYNILERYNTTRNGIRWNNIVFSFKKATILGLFEPFLQTDLENSGIVFGVETNTSYREAYGKFINNGSYIYFSHDHSSRSSSGYRNRIRNRTNKLDPDEWRSKYSYLRNDTSFTIRTLVNADNTGDSEHIWTVPNITAEVHLYITRLSAGISTYYIYFADASNPSDDEIDFNYAIFQGSRFYLD